LKYLKRGKLYAARTRLTAEHVSRTRFEKFFDEFKQEKIGTGDFTWVDEKSPYEVTAEVDFTEAESDEESDEDNISETMEALKL
jgi:hypothetical protein